MFVVGDGCPSLAQSLSVANTQHSFWHCVKRKQRASTLQLLVYSDKDQLYVCVVGVPHLETDKSLLMVFSSPLTQRCSAFQQNGNFLAEASSSVTIMAFSLGSMSPNQTETSHYSPPEQMSAHNQVRTISRSWLDSLPLKTSRCLQPPWKPESPWRRWWSWRSGCWPPFSWPPSLPWWWCADTATATLTTCCTTSTPSQWSTA